MSGAEGEAKGTVPGGSQAELEILPSVALERLYEAADKLIRDIWQGPREHLRAISMSLEILRDTPSKEMASVVLPQAIESAVTLVRQTSPCEEEVLSSAIAAANSLPPEERYGPLLLIAEADPSLAWPSLKRNREEAPLYDDDVRRGIALVLARTEQPGEARSELGETVGLLRECELVRRLVELEEDDAARAFLAEFDSPAERATVALALMHAIKGNKPPTDANS